MSLDTANRFEDPRTEAAIDPAELADSTAVPLPQSPATAYFSARLRQLAENTEVHWLEPGVPRPRRPRRLKKTPQTRLTPSMIQRLLKEQAPDLPVSVTQMYRYYHGEAPPRLDVVFELACLFKVSPAFFLPIDFDSDPDVARPVRRKKPPASRTAPQGG